MKRIIKTIAITAAFTTSLLSIANAKNWDMPMAYSDENFHSQNGKLFAKGVGVCTGGSLNITVHTGGSLFKGNEIKRAVQTGQAPIGERFLSAHQNENILYGVDSIPFLATSYADSEKLWTASKDAITEALLDDGLVLLYTVPWPSQGIYFKKEINSVADMAGIKFRAYNAATSRLAELAGMAPVQIEAADLSQALATGVASSFISSGSTGYDQKLWEQLTHFYDVQAWLPRNAIFVNQKAFDGLTENEQNCLHSVGLMASAAATARSEQLASWYLIQFVKNGMQVLPPSEKLASELKEFGVIMTKEWLDAAGEKGAAIVDAYKAIK